MTRQECEEKLLSLAEQMQAVYLEYNPAGEHLGVIISGDGFICADDCFFTKENEIIRDVHGNMFRTVEVAKFSDGHISYGGKATA